MSATIGDNRPKPMTPEEVAAWLTDTCADLTKRQQEIIAGAERFAAKYPDGIPDEEVQGKAADFAGGKGAMAAFLKLAEARRVSEKQPFDQAAIAVQGFFKKLAEPVAAAQTTMRRAMTAYSDKQEAIKREAARKAAEEAAAKAREAEAEAMKTMKAEELARATTLAQAAEKAEAHAEAKPAEHTRVTGQLGTTVSTHTRWLFKEDESDLLELAKAVVAGKAPLNYLAFNNVRINYAVRSEKVREIPGCVIKEERETR